MSSLLQATPKLARRLIQPDHHASPERAYTLGPAVAELCADIGFGPDPQQELLLDDIFAVGHDGLSACFEYGCVVCRQNLKTGLFKQVAIGWLYVADVPWFIWSAHELSTTLEAQRELHQLIVESALVDTLPATKNQGLYEDNNKTRIELENGQRVVFKARTATGGRGLAAPKIILDEAFALKAAQIGALIPTLGAQVDPQVLYGSSAGKEDALVLADVAARGRSAARVMIEIRAGADKPSPRIGFAEWFAPREHCRTKHGPAGKVDLTCAHPKDAAERGLDCALDREHLWRAANPTISTGRIRLSTIAGFRQALPPAEFMRECLGWWDTPDDGAAETFGPGRWAACATEPDFAVEPHALGLALSRDGTFASIAAAVMVDADDHEQDREADGLDEADETAEPADAKTRAAAQVPIFVAAVDRREDTDWLMERLKQLQDDHDGIPIVIDEKGPAADLLDDFDRHDIAVETIDLGEYADACGRFYRRVRAGKQLHPSSAELDDAVAGAEWRWVGDRRVWGRKQSARDVSMLEAATLASYGAEEFGVGIY